FGIWSLGFRISLASARWLSADHFKISIDHLQDAADFFDAVFARLRRRRWSEASSGPCFYRLGDDLAIFPVGVDHYRLILSQVFQANWLSVTENLRLIGDRNNGFYLGVPSS